MTKIKLIRDYDVKRLECSGHSDYAERGTDIVCASISIMAGAWVALCDAMSKKKEITIIKEEEHDAYISIDIYDVRGCTDSAWKMVGIALKDVAKQYPDNVSVEWEEIKF